MSALSFPSPSPNKGTIRAFFLRDFTTIALTSLSHRSPTALPERELSNVLVDPLWRPGALIVNVLHISCRLVTFSSLFHPLFP